MSDDHRVYIKPTTTSSGDGVRFQDDPKKPSGAASSSKNFKNVLDKEDEDRAVLGRVSEDDEEDAADTITSARSKAASRTKGAKTNASGEEVFSLFGSQKGKGAQKEATLQSGADLSEDPVLEEGEAEVNQTVKTAQNESGTLVRNPKQVQQQSLAESTFAQSTAVEPQTKPVARDPKTTVKEKAGNQDESSSRLVAQGEEYENVYRDDDEGQKQFGSGDFFDTAKEPSSGTALATHRNTPVSQQKEAPVFDLSQNRTGINTVSAEPRKVRPEDIIDNPIAARPLAGTTKPTVTAEQYGETVQDSPVVSPVSKKDNIANPFVREQVDLSSVNPQGFINPVGAPAEIANNIGTPTAAKPMPSTATMYVLLDVLAKEIQTMKVGDKTETTVILQRPPLFANTQVMITGYESAKGELNITFGNLTQNAQRVIEQQQQNLLLALETKGYHVHIFTATTLELQNPIATAQQADQEQQKRQGQGQGQGRNRQQEDEDQQG